MTKSFPSITNLLYTITVTLTECLCQLTHDYTQEASAFILWKSSQTLACKTQWDRAAKKRKRKQNPALLRTSLSSVQETISLQFNNSFRFNLRISVLKFWKKNMYIFTARKNRRQKKPPWFWSQPLKISCSETWGKTAFTSLFPHGLSNNVVTPPIFETLRPSVELYSFLIPYHALKKMGRESISCVFRLWRQPAKRPLKYLCVYR